MAAEDLAKKLMKATKSNNHRKELSKVLTDYLIANVQVPITYVGIIPGTPPVPDPIVADVLGITGDIPDLDNTDFNSWVTSLESGIMTLKLENPGIAGIKPNMSLNIFKKGLNTYLSQDNIKSIHTKPPKDIYKWSIIDKELVIDEDIKEFNSIEELPTDKFISNFAKIKKLGEGGSIYYEFFECIYTACELIWVEISKQIISWIQDTKLHITSFPAQGTASGSKGTATTLPILVL